MKTVLSLFVLCLSGPALAADGFVPFQGNVQFRAYEHGLPAGADRGAFTRTFRQIDTDRDGQWEAHEIERAFGTAAKRDVLMTFDGNGDGCVTWSEFRAFDDGGIGGPDGHLIERFRG